MENEEEQLWFGITVEEIQERALELIDRELRRKELEELRYVMSEYSWHQQEMIDESIKEMVAEHRLIRRNKRADTKPIHYIVYWKNENAFQKEYKKVFAANAEKDAREYISYEFLDEFVHYRITKVDNGVETEIAIIRNEHFHPSTENTEF